MKRTECGMISASSASIYRVKKNISYDDDSCHDILVFQ